MLGRTSKYRLRLAAVAVLAGAVVAGVVTTSRVEASPLHAVTRTYYSNSSFTTRVGERQILNCTPPNNVQLWGHRSSYYVEWTWDCPNTSPDPLSHECYVDGWLSTCPPIF